MSYHHCQIEPDDWRDGPDDYGQFDECPDCDEGRFSREAMWIDGLYYPAIIDQVCDTCCGNGIVFRKDADEDDYGLDDMSCT